MPPVYFESPLWTEKTIKGFFFIYLWYLSFFARLIIRGGRPSPRLARQVNPDVVAVAAYTHSDQTFDVSPPYVDQAF